MSEIQQPVLTIKNVTHRFSGNNITACQNITLQAYKGEILALMGENGAGKSTLMFLLSGFLTPSEGSLSVAAGSSLRDRREFTGMIHQKPLLAGNLTVFENIILEQRGKSQNLFINPKILKKSISEIQQNYDLPLDLDMKGMDLTAPQIQRAELIRALWKKKSLIILDEPTASLSDKQIARLFTLMKQLKDEGKTIIFITHKIHEAVVTADRMAILRRGRLMAVGETRDFDASEISRLMIGEDSIHQTAPAQTKTEVSPSKGKVVLELSGVDVTELGTRRLKGLSLSLRAGEILGISGIRENGLTHLEDLLSGMIQPSKGEILINGRNRMPLTPYRLRRWKISYIPADRLHRGADPSSSLAENLSVLKREISGGFKSYRKNFILWSKKYIKDHNIKGSAEQRVGTLSGGNIQKMIVARELGELPRLLIVSEPSWGLDFKSREELHEQLIKARNNGTAVLLLTTDLDEMLQLSDRACVLTEGILSEISKNDKEWNRTYVGEIMTGADKV
ncbi:ATP-binding cassette domain-containing protein [Oceanispirochaeta crateris]|uniref:ATP-binding cassette domain-containing protein n=1 Tax=Oceanispirochaeta crateris TaxID=2518645 RepID=A0A5C1QNM8_9SPIO|nr:ATP-binding cassette domain-containing protein [Oceanispirochaeta crateris]QEN08580.1 ATP-binding cassette domain-containing protein [Oceanispirochaeta crateris]